MGQQPLQGTGGIMRALKILVIQQRVFGITTMPPPQVQYPAYLITLQLPKIFALKIGIYQAHLIL